MDFEQLKKSFKSASTPFGFRLEPSNKTYSVEEGLKARVKDPLWFLSRQWQLGEFRAQNGGSLVRAEMSHVSKALDTLKVQGAHPKTIPLVPPLEAIVEAEEVVGGPGKSRPVARAWDASRLCYTFSVSGGSTELTAARYDGEYLDWYSFDLISVGSFPGNRSLSVLRPTHVQYHGMPNARWWSFEDRAIALGEVQRPYLNFLTTILLEFGLLYSNDWYIIPVSQEIGYVRCVDFLRVMDTFGVTSTAEPVNDKTKEKRGWEVFTLTQTNNPSDGRLLYIPNNLYHCLESEPVEKVNLFRDEMANLVWAIEEQYQEPGTGKVIKGRDDENSKPAPLTPDTPHYWDIQERKVVTTEDVHSDGEPGTRFIGPLDNYHDRTQLPLNWIPYLPMQVNPDGQIQLRRATTIEPPRKQCKGVLLNESIVIREEEIPRLGIALTRVVQLARGTDNVPVVWIGRRKRPDQRRASSGLRFDYLQR